MDRHAPFQQAEVTPIMRAPQDDERSLSTQTPHAKSTNSTTFNLNVFYHGHGNTCLFECLNSGETNEGDRSEELDVDMCKIH